MSLYTDFIRTNYKIYDRIRKYDYKKADELLQITHSVASMLITINKYTYLLEEYPFLASKCECPLCSKHLMNIDEAIFTDSVGMCFTCDHVKGDFQ